jgi:hypothetical protein
VFEFPANQPLRAVLLLCDAIFNAEIYFREADRVFGGTYCALEGVVSLKST